MSNPNGRKGASFESSLLPLLNTIWPDTIRAGKQGAKDCGDYHMPRNRRYIIEAKNVARMDLAGWLKQAQVEAANKGVPHGVVVHKRKGVADPAEQYVTCTLGTFLGLVHPDE